MSDLPLEFSWRTDVGRVRAHNEDAVVVDPEAGIVVVADGIGGASAGEVASQLATETISNRLREWIQPPIDTAGALYFVERAVDEANRVIWEAARNSVACVGMGTTVVVGLSRPEWMAFGYVGDSRIYRLREGVFDQLTHDHSLIQEVVDQGFFPSLRDAQRYGINENVLTRGLGTASSVEVDLGESDLLPGDVYMFCSDGLTGMVPDDSIRRVLLDRTKKVDELTETLIELACDSGGFDNITVAVMRVMADERRGR